MNAKSPRAAACLIAVATLTFSLAACSSGTSTTASSTSSAGPERKDNPSAGLTGAPIQVMTIGNWTQPQLGTSNPEYPAGAQAAAAAVNAAGGIGGRPIEVIVCSDELSPDTARQCARTAVEKKISAVVGLQTTNETTILPILESAGIPAVGVYPFTDAALTSPVSYPDVSGFVGQTLGMGLQLATNGATKVNTVVPGGLGGISSVMGDAIAAGAAAGQVPYGDVVEIPAKSSDLSAVIATATSDGASVAGFATDEAEFIRAMRTLAPDSLVTTFPFNLTENVLQSVGQDAEGVLSVEGFAPPSSSTPGAEQFAQDLAAYDSSLAVSPTGLHEWLAMWTFARVVAPLGDVTPQTVSGAMDQVRNLDMGGLTPPYSTATTNTQYPRMFNQTVVFQTVTDGRIVLQTPGDEQFVDIGDLIQSAAG
jgi:branched-chain amino acid transport system substrate-binding protein